MDTLKHVLLSLTVFVVAISVLILCKDVQNVEVKTQQIGQAGSFAVHLC